LQEGENPEYTFMKVVDMYFFALGDKYQRKDTTPEEIKKMEKEIKKYLQ
jgi:hypothetical protein